MRQYLKRGIPDQQEHHAEAQAGEKGPKMG